MEHVDPAIDRTEPDKVVELRHGADSLLDVNAAFDFELLARC
jgi:hypothetical protein